MICGGPNVVVVEMGAVAVEGPGAEGADRVVVPDVEASGVETGSSRTAAGAALPRPRFDAAFPRGALGFAGTLFLGAAGAVVRRFFGAGPSSAEPTLSPASSNASGSMASSSSSFPKSSIASSSNRRPRSNAMSRKMCSARRTNLVMKSTIISQYSRTLVGALMNARCINSLLNARELRNTSDVPRTIKR